MAWNIRRELPDHVLGLRGNPRATLIDPTPFSRPMFPTWTRWPILGLFLFFGVFHLGFGCHRTEPGVTTDPGTTTPESSQALTSSSASGVSAPMAALGILPLAGGLGLAILGRFRQS